MESIVNLSNRKNPNTCSTQVNYIKVLSICAVVFNCTPNLDEKKLDVFSIRKESVN